MTASADVAADIAALIEKIPGLIDERTVHVPARAQAFAHFIGLVAPMEGPRATKRFKRKGSAASERELRKIEQAAKRLWRALHDLSSEAHRSLEGAVRAYNEHQQRRGLVLKYPHHLQLSETISLLVGRHGLIERAVEVVAAKGTAPAKRSAKFGRLLAAKAMIEYKFFTELPAERSDSASWFVSEIFKLADCEDSPGKALQYVVECIARGENPFEKLK